MAATLETSQNLVPLPEIPVKLRCNICSGLARGAVRLPCCEQAICETCRANLPGVCPVCDHSPLNPDDCKVNTALRTTVAVFLRTAEKKHALSLQKEQKASQLQHNQQLQHLHQQAQPLEPTRIPEVKITQKILSDRPTITTSEKSPPLKSKSPNHVGDVEPLDEEKNDVFKADQENISDVPGEKRENQDPTAVGNNSTQQMGYNQENGRWFNNQMQEQMGNPTQPAFPGQDLSVTGWGPYAQMQGGWDGTFAAGLMGYPMMNPIAMAQSGYGGSNFGNMGVGGYSGQNGGGMGWNNGWNGQSNMGYNQGMGGMRNGGYYSAASSTGGYNHQSQGSHQVLAQQYQNPHFHRHQNFQRGGFTSGGGTGNRSYTPDPSLQQQQIYGDEAFQQQIQGIEEVAVAVKKMPVSTSGEIKGEKIPSIVSGESDHIDAIATIPADQRDFPTDTESTVVAGLCETVCDAAPPSGEGVPILSPNNVSTALPMNLPDPVGHVTVPHDDYSGQSFLPNFSHQQPYGNGYQARGSFRGGGFRGNYNRAGFGGGARGGHFGADVTVSNGVLIPPEKIPPEGIGKGVEGAPTGPKAMREGRTHRGIIPRGGGFAGRGPYNGPNGGGPLWSRSISPQNFQQTTDCGTYSRSVSANSGRRSRSPLTRDASRDRDRERHRSKSPSHDRSGSLTRRHRSRSPRRRRSPSVPEDTNSPVRGRTPKRNNSGASLSAAGPADAPSLPQPPPLSPPPQTNSPPPMPTCDVNPRSPSQLSPNPEDHRRLEELQQVPSSARSKRSRSPSASRIRVPSPSRSCSRTSDHRHKRSRRHHRRRSVSPEREKERERSTRRHKRSHRHHHRSSRKHRSRSRSPGGGSNGVDSALAAAVDSKQRSSGQRRRDKDRDCERDRDRERERDRDSKHRSHRTSGRLGGHRSSRKDEKSGDKEKSERRVSYKYEDEGDLERRAERDREAERWFNK